MAVSTNLAQGINTAGNAYVSAKATRAQGEYQKRIADINARTADAQAEDAVARGDREAAKKLQDTRKAMGAQKAAMAANGMDVNSADAIDILNETEVVGQTDIATIKTNAWREAWGYKSQAVSMAGEGNMKNLAAQNTARATLISGGMDAMTYGLKAGDAYKNKPKKAKG